MAWVHPPGKVHLKERTPVDGGLGRITIHKGIAFVRRSSRIWYVINTSTHHRHLQAPWLTLPGSAQQAHYGAASTLPEHLTISGAHMGVRRKRHVEWECIRGRS